MNGNINHVRDNMGNRGDIRGIDDSIDGAHDDQQHGNDGIRD